MYRGRAPDGQFLGILAGSVASEPIAASDRPSHTDPGAACARWRRPLFAASPRANRATCSVVTTSAPSPFQFRSRYDPGTTEGEMGMAEDRDLLLQHYRQMRDELLSAIHGLSGELMTESSLDGWSVKDHLAHLALWDDIRASEVVRISAGHDSAWRMTHDQDAAFNAVGHSLRLALSLDQVRWELATSRQRLLDAISSAAPRGLDASLYGEAGLRSSHESAHTAWITRWREERASK